MIFLTLKSLCSIIYPTRIEWVGQPPKNWNDVKLIFLLNHTSLAEFIYLTIFPISYLWTMSKELTFPVAKETYHSGGIARIIRLFGSHVIPISRKRDDTWGEFLSKINPHSILIMMPEGRMRRPSGLDKHGKPMNSRTGAYDVLENFKGSKLLIAYSGGLHHVLAPGQKIPRFPKKLTVKLELLDIQDYLARFDVSSLSKLKLDIAKDLDRRRECHTPLL